jgi:hypothetical protein
MRQKSHLQFGTAKVKNFFSKQIIFHSFFPNHRRKIIILHVQNLKNRSNEKSNKEKLFFGCFSNANDGLVLPAETGTDGQSD